MSNQSEALSPWGMKPAHAVEIFPLEKPFSAEMALPGSKSFTNRALVLAALAEGQSVLRSPLFSDDSYWCVDALKKLGVKIESDKDAGTIILNGNGRLTTPAEGKPPYIGSAGTIARFLPGLIAARGEGDVILTSSGQLARRPVSEMIEALRALGAEISFTGNGSFPMTIKGGSLKGGETEISGKKSSQFVSGLLIAAPLAKEPVTIRITDHIVQADYVRITLAMMRDFGVKVDYDDADLREFRIEPQNYIACDIVLEADASTATYFFGIAAATRSEITITNLNPDTLQPDIGFIGHLESLGCEVKRTGTHITVRGPEKLKGNKTFDLNDCSDSTPALVGVAPFADGPVRVENVAHIRAHESDRIAVMCQTLRNGAVPVEEFEDGLAITPSPDAPVHLKVYPHDDHRMAMAFAVTAAAAKGGTIYEPACVSKTCPDFFELLGRLGVRTEIRQD